MHEWFYDDGRVLLENELVAFISLICHFGMWQTGQGAEINEDRFVSVVGVICFGVPWNVWYH